MIKFKTFVIFTITLFFCSCTTDNFNDDLETSKTSHQIKNSEELLYFQIPEELYSHDNENIETEIISDVIFFNESENIVEIEYTKSQDGIISIGITREFADFMGYDSTFIIENQDVFIDFMNNRSRDRGWLGRFLFGRIKYSPCNKLNYRIKYNDHWLIGNYGDDSVPC